MDEVIATAGWITLTQFHQQSKELMSDSSSWDGAVWRSGRSFRRAGLCGPNRRHLGSTCLPVPPLMSLFLSDRELALTGPVSGLTGPVWGSGEARVEATPTWKGAVLLGRSTLAMSQLSEASWASHSR